jgi:hypothetical protein
LAASRGRLIGCYTPADTESVRTIAFILWLFPTLLAPSHHSALGFTHSAPLPAAGAPPVAFAVAAHKVQQHSGVAARATERKLLLLAPRHRLLRRFVDRTTGLVKRNVAAHCGRYRGHVHHQRQHFLCRVWVQPRPSSSGVAVICHTTAHHVFKVSAYEPRRRRHKTRR